MYKRILLAYDGSEAGQKALLDCQELAHWSHADLFLVAVMPPVAAFIGAEGGVYDVASEERDRERYEAILAEGLTKLSAAGHTVKGELLSGDAVDEIARCAERLEADLVIVGHKHLDSWAARWWRGSVSKSLIEHAPCSVLVVITR